MFHTTFFSFLYMLKKKFRKRFCTCVMGKKQQKNVVFYTSTLLATFFLRCYIIFVINI